MRLWPGPHRRPQPPIGQFRNAVPSPQDGTGAILSELFFQLTDSPGLRVASTTGRRTYHGGGLPLQRFTRPPSHPNSEENLLPLRRAVGASVARRAYGRARGVGSGM